MTHANIVAALTLMGAAQVRVKFGKNNIYNGQVYSTEKGESNVYFSNKTIAPVKLSKKMKIKEGKKITNNSPIGSWMYVYNSTFNMENGV